MEVSRSLLECLSQEGLSVKLSGKLARPSALQLKTFIQQFKSVCLRPPHTYQLVFVCVCVYVAGSTPRHACHNMLSCSWRVQWCRHWRETLGSTGTGWLAWRR